MAIIPYIHADDKSVKQTVAQTVAQGVEYLLTTQTDIDKPGTAQVGKKICIQELASQNIFISVMSFIGIIFL